MNSKFFKSLFGILAILFAGVFVWASALTIHIIDVGQGDCELIVSPTGKTVLIDAGRNGKGSNVVIPYLQQKLHINKLDYIVATHYDADHVAGIAEVVNGLGGISAITTKVYDRGGAPAEHKDFFDEYIDAVGEKRTTIVPGGTIDLGGGAILTCIAVNGHTQSTVAYTGPDENNLSVAFILDYYDFQVYLGGDCESIMEKASASLAGNTDVYKVNHHGSKNSSTQEFLEVIRPEVSTISVGNNSYDHPTSDVHTRLVSIGSYIYQTETGCRAPAENGEVANGSFYIESDGSSYTVRGSDLNPNTFYTDGSHDIPHIVFSEVLYDSEVSGDTAGEWLELYNPGSTSVNIGGWTIRDNAKTYTIPSGTSIGAQSYLVIANDQSTFYQEYGCNPDISGLTLGLNNDGDYLTLKNSSGSVIDQVAWESGGANVSGWGSPMEPHADEGKSIVRSNVYHDTDTYQDWLNNQTPNPCNTPKITLNRTQLYFGAAGGVETNSQSFLIGNSGGGTLNWTVSPNAAWLSCTPTQGTQTGQVDVSINSAGLAAGTYTGTVTVSAANAANSPQSVAVTLVVYNTGSSSLPFGDFTTPTEGASVQSSIPVTGWVLDDIEVISVKLYNGSDYIGDAVFVEGARPDVEQSFPGYPNNYKAGWGYMMLTNFLPNGGNGTYTLHAIATDAEGNQVTLGSKTIMVDNAHAVKPLGALDTPGQGGIASGSRFTNAGWVLTPQPNSIPTNGSTIDVYVDGVYLGHPTYNIYRSDIASLLPGYANSGGAGGYFYLDTTPYENGVHTIHWAATDSGGNWDGIGSRYFTIQNLSGSSKQGTAYSKETQNRTPCPVSRVSSGGQVVEDWKYGRLEYWRDGKASFGQVLKTPAAMPLFTQDINASFIDSSEPVQLQKGYNSENEPETLYPDDSGNITIEIRELERIVIYLEENEVEGNVEPCVQPIVSNFHLTPNTEHLTLKNTSAANYRGYLMNGDRLKPLPVGSTLDAAGGVFYWQPGPGFIGEYSFVFMEKQSGQWMRRNITVRIVPKY